MADTIYVSPDGNDSNDGTSWASAKQTIQAGVDAAPANGVVLVTNGMYVLTEQIIVSNAITVRSVNGPEETTVDGNGQATSNRVFYLNPGCILDGFTVTNGYSLDYDGGGGIYCVDTSAVITNCTISGNTADFGGGGVYVGTLNNCTISGNTASWNGGGAYMSTLSNCTISGNKASSGGGANDCTLNNCTISGNRASYGGGANGGTLNNCTITGNTAPYSGGGAYDGVLNNCTITGNEAYWGGGADSGILNNCTIIGNTAESYGGGASGGTLNNCTITGNTAPYDGGGAFGGTLNNCTISGNTAEYGGGAYNGTLNNCTISGNTAEYGGGASEGTLNNCTISGNEAYWGGGAFGGILNNCTIIGNTAENYGGGANGGTLNNCIAYYNDPNDISGGTAEYTCASDAPAGSGNTTSAPMFIDHLAGNYRLAAGSPCINAGDNALAPTNVTPLDLDGHLRIWDSTVDMGAYEYGSILPIPTNLTASQGTDADSVLLAWTAVFAATDYEVWRHTSDNSGTASKITDTVTTNYQDTTAVPETVYYYWVKSISPSGTSGFSVVACGWRLGGTVATPYFNPDSGAYVGSSVNVTISCDTAGATIRYTTNGSDPTESGAAVASGSAVSVPVPGTLKAKAWKAAMDPSAIKSANYTAAETVATPTFNPDGGAHLSGSVNVTISCATVGATIRYTTNDSEPTESSAVVASGSSVSVPVPGTLKAKAWKAGMYTSAAKVAAYTAQPGPEPDDPNLYLSILANNQHDTVTLAQNDPVSLAVGVHAGRTPRLNVDWFAIAVPISGNLAGGNWLYLNSAMQWVPFNAGDLTQARPALMAPLADVNPPFNILTQYPLPSGHYNFYFALDYPADGVFNGIPGYHQLDMVQILKPGLAPLPALDSRDLQVSIFANGQRGALTLNQTEALDIAVGVHAGNARGYPVDWFAIAVPISGELAGGNWFYLNSAMQWASFDAGNLKQCRPALQAGLVDVQPSVKILSNYKLPVGKYAFYFAVDYPADGVFNGNPGYHQLDMVLVIVE